MTCKVLWLLPASPPSPVIYIFKTFCRSVFFLPLFPVYLYFFPTHRNVKGDIISPTARNNKKWKGVCFFFIIVKNKKLYVARGDHVRVGWKLFSLIWYLPHPPDKWTFQRIHPAILSHFLRSNFKNGTSCSPVEGISWYFKLSLTFHCTRLDYHLISGSFQSSRNNFKVLYRNNLFLSLHF